MKTNEEYHSNRTHLNSSSLKLLLKDAAAFDKMWNQGISEENDKEVYQEGALVHSIILEPHLVEAEYAFFPGLRRAGKIFEEFKVANPGKRVLTEAQKLRVLKYVEAFNRNPEALRLVSTGSSEHTVEGEILGVPCKVRFDKIDFDSGVALDVKTTGMPSGKEMFQDAVKSYGYDLSAAMYLELAERKYGKKFKWYFLVISKTDLDCKVYTLSDETLRTGKAFLYAALTKYKRCKESGIWVDTPQKPCDDITEVEEV